ncbi:sulfotransferase [Actinorhabdospora filicis]|uniref:Sulfotransferase n=1 Tax=Actinorhabdospora filicis TaxID=1785913 RepID=A0A9W6W5Z8_9ACTN|nr:sulfotransferase [Actinorhabdospora filicis]
MLFIGGLGRSGTTLLERLLGQLPGTLPLGEVAHLWERDIRDDERCACGSRFSMCEFWHRVGQRAFGGWDNVDLARVEALRATVDRTRHIPTLAGKKLAPVQYRLVTEYADFYRRVYAAASADAGGNRLIIDSSKHASLAYCLRWSPNVDLRVVHVVRDSRGVAYSWTKQVRRPETGGAAEMTRYSPARSAMLWNAQNAAFSMLRRRGVPVRRVRYEKLLADPRTVVERLAEFALVPLEPGDLRYIGSDYADLGPNHSAAGNPMRFSVGRIPLRRDEEWRDELPSAQRRLVRTLTAPLLNRYGYISRPVELPAPAPPSTVETVTAAPAHAGREL